MTGTVPAEPVAAPSQAVVARWQRVRPILPDCAVALAFVLLAAWLSRGLWPDPGARMLALNPQDQVLYEWFLADDARVLLGHAGLLTDRLNAPDGVNLLANTSVLALGVLLAPVTAVLGAPTAFALLLAGNLALTAIAWYLLFSRTLRAHRAAAGLGAGLCGFAPGMVSQSNGHLHMTAQWLVPVLVWLVVRLLRAARVHDGRRVVTSGLGLGLVAIVQVFVGEEVLFLTALTLLLLGVVRTVQEPALARRVARGLLAGLAVAAGLASAVLAYPLWFQFAGPQGVRGGLFDPRHFSTDLASWVTASPLSLAGRPGSASLAGGPAEYNSFLGWTLLLVAAGCMVWLARHPLIVACAVSAAVLAELSAGPELVVGGERTGIPGPYAVLMHLPLVEAALPTRFALAVVPLLATILVLAVDRALRANPAPPGDADPVPVSGADPLPVGAADPVPVGAADPVPVGAADAGPVGDANSGPDADGDGDSGTAAPARTRDRAARLLVPALVVAALLPIVPRPLPTADRPALPEFVTGGGWRDCVQPGGVLVPVPLPTPAEPWTMRWGAAAGARFGMPEGFFIGPYGFGGGAAMGTGKRPTSALLAGVAETGTVPRIGGADRLRAYDDVAFWRASCVALDPGAAHADALRVTLVELYGPGRRIADVWTWQVR